MYYLIKLIRITDENTIVSSPMVSDLYIKMAGRDRVRVIGDMDFKDPGIVDPTIQVTSFVMNEK